MSLVFSDTSTNKGIVQMYERECGFSLGDVSGSTTRLKNLTADVNLAMDDFLSMAIPASGTWQFDDSNHPDYPIISTNLVANKQDYVFTQDGNGNLILDVYKVFVSNSSGLFTEVTPVDVQSQTNTTGFTNGQNTTGTPLTYEKTGNGIFLNPIPSANITGGLKIYINREASYFTYTDTTKKPGVPGLLHKYFYLRPAADYARRNNLANANALEKELLDMEGDERMGIVGSIARYFSSRPRDEKPRLVGGYQNNR